VDELIEALVCAGSDRSWAFSEGSDDDYDKACAAVDVASDAIRAHVRVLLAVERERCATIVERNGVIRVSVRQTAAKIRRGE
jgi:hypothetical protein